MKYFSMFSGVGGFEYGIQQTNNSGETESQQTQRHGHSSSTRDNAVFRQNNLQTPEICVGVCEIDKYASQVIKYQYPGVKNYGDATKIKEHELPGFDMLVGGFPCQAFSLAGKRRGFEDTRGTLFFEITRVIRAKKPKIVWLENVKGLLNHNKGETFRVILQTLDAMGYNTQWMVLNSKFFGVPQNRERVFIIGSIRGEPKPEILPFRSTDEPIIGKSKIERIDSQAHRKRDCEFLRVYSHKGISPTLSSSGIKDTNYSIDVNRIRRLTPVECERLQGFPDDWTKYGIDEKGDKVEMSDTQRYKMMGNAVTTKVISAIAGRLL